MFCAKDAAAWKAKLTAGCTRDEAQYRICMARCLDDLFRKSDAVYGQRMPDGAHRERVAKCAAGIGHVARPADLLTYFMDHWMNCDQPPTAGDIIAIRRTREAVARITGLELVHGGLHA